MKMEIPLLDSELDLNRIHASLPIEKYFETNFDHVL